MRKEGDVAVLLGLYSAMSGGVVTRVLGIAVRPDCDRPAVAEWIAEQITPQGRKRARNESRHGRVKNNHDYWSVRLPRREFDWSRDMHHNRRASATEKRSQAIGQWLGSINEETLFGLILSHGERIVVGFGAREGRWVCDAFGKEAEGDSRAACFTPARLREIALATGYPLPADLR